MGILNVFNQTVAVERVVVLETKKIIRYETEEDNGHDWFWAALRLGAGPRVTAAVMVSASQHHN